MAASSPALTKYLFETVTASATDDHLPSCTITTISPDREGDRVIPEGGDFANFMKSPVLMWAHGGADRYGAVPIGTVTTLDIQPGRGIKASWKWLEGDVFADRIRNAWDQGVVRASSIGFRPIKRISNGTGMDHETWELLELSLCAVPMNPEAVRTLKSLGLLDAPTRLFGPDGQPVVTDGQEEPMDAHKIDSAEVEKRGRVLSAVNESRLRAALTALTDANTVLNEVLAQLVRGAPEEPEVDDDDTLQAPTVTMPALEDEARYSLTLAEEALTQDGLRLFLAEEDTITLIDDAGREPTFAIDPLLMRAVIAETVSAQMQTALVDPIGESIRQALDRARGRVT